MLQIQIAAIESCW